jgi:outer membrane protein OmpA-like peptidoglycan-associated protein
VKGYGETKPVNKCVDGVPCTDDEYQANRRTEFKVIEINK